MLLTFLHPNEMIIYLQTILVEPLQRNQTDRQPVDFWLLDIMVQPRHTDHNDIKCRKARLILNFTVKAQCVHQKSKH